MNHYKEQILLIVNLVRDTMDNGGVYRHLFVTGLPGVGKTTLVCRLCELLRRESVRLRGFYTTEVRSSVGRTGFEIVTVDGSQRGTLATVKPPPGGPYPSVGRYSVVLNQFEPLALEVFRQMFEDSSSIEPTVFVVDEIGKMELTSKPFGQAALQVFSQPSTIVVATVPAKPLRELEAFAEHLVFSVDWGNVAAVVRFKVCLRRCQSETSSEE
uniref:AAA+ ATPase domain-containing protein n=1 Tax=Trichuris muris TaxID=70415 RepID=A0A5S6Q3U0_TRIMR